ncbi:MAG: hypothetical protein ACRD33_08300, partial [Candidatus Acidiferrales bacterium]
ASANAATAKRKFFVAFIFIVITGFTPREIYWACVSYANPSLKVQTRSVANGEQSVVGYHSWV